MSNSGENVQVLLGPFDVSLEEPVYFKITPNADGKTIKDVDMVNGFVHRGMESIVMKRNFIQNVIVTEKVCGLCSNNHPFTYCMAVEEIANIQVPLRGKYLRVIADEIKRVASHLFNIGMLSHLIGNHEIMTKIMETREYFQDIKEKIWGNRMDLGANTIGGVKYDLNDEMINFIYKQIADSKNAIDAIISFFETDNNLKSRIQGIGVLSKEDAQKLGVVGPVARASGVNNDVRKKSPYSVYERLQFDVVLRENGDVYSRAMVRLYEILQSIKLIDSALQDLPQGDVVVAKRPSIPEGETISRTEAPRGELMYYLKTNGGKSPQRMRWRVPTYMNWEALKIMLKDNAIEDIAVIFNSIDPCISCTER